MWRFIRKLKRQERRYFDEIRAELADDTCRSANQRFYLLAGPLSGSVCAGHMRDQWRIAYTFEHSAGDDPTLVVILYLDRYTSDSDPWDDLHELFELESPESGHDKPPCCEEPFQPLDPDLLDVFEGRVRRFLLRKHSL